MKRKPYIQPSLEVTPVTPTSMICQSYIHIPQGKGAGTLTPESKWDFDEVRRNSDDSTDDSDGLW